MIISDWIMILSLWGLLLSFIVFVIGWFEKDHEYVRFSGLIAALSAIVFLVTALSLMTVQVLGL